MKLIDTIKVDTAQISTDSIWLNPSGKTIKTKVFINGKWYMITPGYRYDELTNTFAVNEKTVVTGKDAFIAGRFNESDTTNKYAEIIGGGTGVELLVGTEYITPKGGKLTYLGCSKDEADNYLESVGSYVYFDAMPEGYSVSDITHIFGTKSNGIVFGYYWVVFSDGSWYFANNTGHSSYDRYKQIRRPLSNCITYVAGWIAISALISNLTGVAYKNIRTLDWNGNMELKGSLTLGNTTITETQLAALLATLE